jgi:hypothetical protein
VRWLAGCGRDARSIFDAGGRVLHARAAAVLTVASFAF